MDRTSLRGVETAIDTCRAEELLARIAAVLGCPVGALRGDMEAAGHLEETSDLLRLWLAIENPKDRRRLLELTRTLAKGALPRRDL